MKRLILPAALLYAALCPIQIYAWNQSEIQWMTIPTEHFRIQYHPGLERYAAQAAEIAEAVYGPVTEFYRYRPDGAIYINISDKEDESEGATYFYLNRIDITATPLDFAFRGSSAWLWDVITHEFTHMVSVQSSFKFPRWIPSVYFQAVNFEKEKRPDVISGYPNLMVSLPIPGELLPNWFAEGIAQYQCRAERHDMWDSHRDMLLRTAFLGGRLLTMDEMGVFGKNSRGSEMVYNQGFSMVRFIAKRFGESALRELASACSSLRDFTFDGACRRVLGMGDEELYRMWKDDLAAKYNQVAARVKEREVEGARETRGGFLNLCPVPCRGKGGFYYLSNAGYDYQHLDLVYRAPDGKERTLARSVGAQYSVLPDGRKICFTRRTRRNEYQYLRNDVYRYDLESKKDKRVTRGLRATNPEWSPDGKQIACVVTGGGSQRLARVDPETGSYVLMTPAADRREYYRLSWASRGILASRFEGLSRDIVLVDPLTGAETAIMATPADERDPSWDEDGTGFFYSSDRTGIFNIYYHGLDDGVDLMVTNCIGGAFCPKPAGADLYFSGYAPDGFEIHRLENWRASAVPMRTLPDDEKLMEERQSLSVAYGTPGRSEAEGPASTLALTGAKLEAPQAAKHFGIEYTKLFLYPRVMVYEKKLRVGVFLDSGDYLGRQSVFAGGSINAEGDFDLNLSVETRQFKPTFGLDVFRNRKHYSYGSRAEDANRVMRDVQFKVRYDLWDSYFSCKMELQPTTEFYRNEAVLQYNHGEYGLNVELWWLLKQREFGGEGGWNYYLANELSFLWHYRNIREEVDADVNPRGGRTVDLEVTRAYDKLHSGEFSKDLPFKPDYNENFFGRYTLTYEEFIPLPFWRHALTLHLQGGGIDRSHIDDFFYLYLGSLDGLRGYSYFSMGGTKIAMARATYRFPLLCNVNRQVLHVYLGSLYGGIFAEAGKAWNENEFDLDGNKKDVGFEFRFKGFTFYSYPIAASFEGAYGLDDVVYRNPLLKDGGTTFYEGKKWKFYGSILFGF